MTNLIPLSEAELAALIRLGTPLSLAFGAGGVALKPNESPRAVPILAELRGLAKHEGKAT